ncbi:hypothetical protein [Bacillus subtilis]|uniref:hypothetical protein n=1 Tax=Bacillus subtilis TaxID=1423 RepID=UPI0039F6D5F6
MDKDYGISLKAIQKKAENTVNDLQKTGRAVINNTIDDIQLVLGGISECLKEVDKIRIRAIHRAIEYHTLYQRSMIEAGILRVDLIDKVWEKVFGKIEGNANPKIYQLRNPKQAVWSNSKPIMIPINLDSHTFPQRRAPYLFVHGAGKRGNEEEAFDFYEQFELNAKMFNNSNHDYSSSDIYIVSYDSLITNNTKLIIKDAFESVLGTLSDSDAPLLFTAVVWREWEKRAEETAEKVILPFMRKMSESGIEAPRLGAGAITHSLGCYALSHAAQLFVSEIPEPSLRPFSFWFCMAAALPSNAFTSTGQFPLAPLIAGRPYQDNLFYGTSVWFSNLDATLGVLYSILANRYFSMGQTGSLVSKEDLVNLDVTRCSGLEHDYPIYFKLVKNVIRSALGTEVWSEQPHCELKLPTIKIE